MTLMNILIDTGRDAQGCGRCTECKCKADRPLHNHPHDHSDHLRQSLDQAGAAPHSPAPSSDAAPAA